jgi:hypothetical protein
MDEAEMALVERFARVVYYNTMLAGVYSICYGESSYFVLQFPQLQHLIGMFFVVFVVGFSVTL